MEGFKRCSWRVYSPDMGITRRAYLSSDMEEL